MKLILIYWINVFQENIKRLGNMNEINSKVLTTSYLSDLENITKQTCLGWLSPHTEIVTYDWNKGGNNMDIVYDIEQLDLEEDVHKEKFFDWMFSTSDNLIEYMSLYQEKMRIYCYMDHIIEVNFSPELYCVNEEKHQYDEEIEKVSVLFFVKINYFNY